MPGKAKTAIPDFAYCGSMHRDTLKTLERKYGQPETVLSAYFDKLANYPPFKMHSSVSIFSYSAFVFSLVFVFLNCWKGQFFSTQVYPVQLFRSFATKWQNGCWKIQKGPPFKFLAMCDFSFCVIKGSSIHQFFDIFNSFRCFWALDISSTRVDPSLLLFETTLCSLLFC